MLGSTGLSTGNHSSAACAPSCIDSFNNHCVSFASHNTDAGIICRFFDVGFGAVLFVMTDDEPPYPLDPWTTGRFTKAGIFRVTLRQKILTSGTPVVTMWAGNDLAGGNGTATQRTTSCATQFVGASNQGDVRLMGLGGFVVLLALVLGLL
ncbi:uncharacterized protein K444DRAFT_195326 [Hyaloscypha bicolor E]|uniref:Uncharacterized protein n=1 Tax=Hyaloscypha bicolor E TaxID=1095630 RepID=A0A2J6SQD6_9HELO|nr:uncharacterized protein K444DRAFT_195326 [Hyaloscypha bicolor E]PMD52975.1 hypothetical protein K444DRAFT_195326 [Hyaloscypha bicolor E]